MSKQILIVVESPTKARTLSRYLGSDYRIEASMGHIRDLPAKRLGVNVNKNFEPAYEIPKNKKQIVEKLQAAVKNASDVVLATDPDREGEAIAWHVAHVISNTKGQQFKRIVFHQITRNAIEEAIKHPRTLDMNLVDAQQGRRILDRLVGYKLSPILWYKTGKNWLSAGRVQSVAVRLIVEREREILAFVPDEYWEVHALLHAPHANSDFIAKLVKIGGEKVEIGNKEKADTVLSDLQKASYRVSSVEKKEIKRKPLAPYITSTLQRAASSSFGWSARKTMTIAQNLYEKGKITYHRTDSVQLSPEGIAMAREFIEKSYGREYLPDQPNIYTTKSKVAQEAHEAIRPTRLSIVGVQSSDKPKTDSPQPTTSSSLGRDHQKLLDLIAKRFVSSQMKDQVLERETIEINAENRHAELDSASDNKTLNQVQGDSIQNYLLRASGEKEVFPGWKKVYEQHKGKGSKDQKSKEGTTLSELQSLLDTNVIPAVSENDPLDLLKLFPEQKFTQPPPRYNEASLIKALEEQGIGRPSTYAPTLTTIQARQYVEKNESRAFVPTELGIMVNDFLVEKFSDVINVRFTAGMEDKLDDIAKGEQKWQDVIREFWIPFDKHLTATRQTVEKIKVPVKKTGERCPECGEDLVERTGRYGAFIACSGFPKCKFTKPVINKLEMKCEKCKEGDIIIKKTRQGRKFYGCSRYPDCDFASWTKPKTQDTQDSRDTQDTRETQDSRETQGSRDTQGTRGVDES